MIEVQEQGLNRIFLENCSIVEASNSEKMSILENNNTSADKSGDNNQLIEDNESHQPERSIQIKQEKQDESCVDQQVQNLEANQMNPIETATLLLLSRIAFFNKVKPTIFPQISPFFSLISNRMVVI